MAKYIDKVKQAWLFNELIELREHGVLDAAAEQRIRDYYAEAVTEQSAPPSSAKTVRHQYAHTALVSLGVFLVGCGVILIFAYNWDMLSKFQRVAAAFVPVVIGACCGVYTIVKEKNAGWREASAFFTAVGFAVLTALISQIYHTGGTLLEFTKLVLAVSLPLVYLFRSHMLAAVYCSFLFVFLEYGRMGWHSASLYYVAGIAPFILYYLFFHKPEDMRTVWMRYICLIPLVYLLVNFSVYTSTAQMLFAAAGLLYTAGLSYGETKRGPWRNPWLPCGWLSFTVLLCIASISSYFLTRSYFGAYRWDEVLTDTGVKEYNQIRAYLLSGLWLPIFAVQVYAAARKVTPLKITVALVTLLPLAVFLFRIPRETTIWVSSACFLLVGVAALLEGVKERGLMKINAGMLQIALLAAIKFADERMSILTRAMGFIIIGVAFIVINVYVGRKFRREKTLVATERGAQSDAEKDA